jgi:arabinan endo-1,5-alpha-L-arabinosidase
VPVSGGFVVVRRVALAAGALLTAALAACGGSASSSSSSPASGTASAGSPSASAAPAAVLDEDFPDPDLMNAGGTWYAYATQRTGPFGNLQVATSKDLRVWNLLSTDPLPTLPAWATAGRTWAPDVSAASGGYVLYFAAHSVDPDVQCIGVARSTSPTGPFTPVGEKALVCPADLGGAIDPASFVDADGTRYLLYKNDGNCCGKDTWLWLQRMSPDGLRLVGAPTKLIKQDRSWEGNLVEAPDLVRHGSTYTLLYSANDYSGPMYATGYATAAKISGAYTKAVEPLLRTRGTEVIGPGGEDVVTDAAGRSWIAFHGWDPGRTRRAMYVLPLTWQGNRPVVSP